MIGHFVVVLAASIACVAVLFAIKPFCWSSPGSAMPGGGDGLRAGATQAGAVRALPRAVWPSGSEEHGMIGSRGRSVARVAVAVFYGRNGLTEGDEGGRT